MKISFQREAFDSFYPEALPLLELHKLEIAAYPDIELSVDVERYREMEALDSLRIYTARKDDALIGYAVFHVGPNAHYMESLQAVQDVIYVSRDHRGSRAGIGLIRFSEAELAKEDVQAVYHHVKLAHPMLGRILAKEGYAEVERIFAKRLDW